MKRWEKNYWDEVRMKTKPFPETGYVLEKLSNDHELALITNISGISRRRLADFPEIYKFFKLIIFAGESDIPAKPNKKPFILCLKSLGISPDEAVYVGDDYDIDICGASRAGIKPIWIKHELAALNWPDVKTDVPIIYNLYELFDLEELL